MGRATGFAIRRRRSDVRAFFRMVFIRCGEWRSGEIGFPSLAPLRIALPLLAALTITINPAHAEDSAPEGSDTESVEMIGDVEAGKKRFRRECRQCHGPTAKGVSSYPKLVGHPAEYLINQLERYRAGEKIGPNTPLMAPRAKKLKDKDIADLAAFIVSLEET